MLLDLYSLSKHRPRRINGCRLAVLMSAIFMLVLTQAVSAGDMIWKRPSFADQSNSSLPVCLSQTSSGWQMIANRAMLSPYVGPLQTDLAGARRPLPIETSARGGDPGAAPSDQCPAADRAKKASPQQHRPIDIRRPLSTLPRCSRRADDRQAGYRDPLAPGGVQSLLAMEIENPQGDGERYRRRDASWSVT